MRRRVKRRLFLMSMALATGASGHAYAQGGKSIPGQGHDFGGGYPAASLPLADGDGLEQGANSGTLLHQVKALLGGLGYGTEAAKPATAPKDWRLQLLPPETRSDLGGDFRTDKAKRFGVALRMSF